MIFQFAKNVADSKELRDASTDAGKKLDNLSTDLSARKDVFEVVKAFAETEEAKMLDHEKKRLSQTSYLGFDLDLCLHLLYFRIIPYCNLLSFMIV